ncbi:hypothetical protein AGMMS50218_10580 [Actinomycetota bacterium]|nr:hypothetical protein AGMMS50218_10580 [Actinomycetota bacterium]
MGDVTSPASTPDVSALSYEQARDELVAVVARLEAGGATLEESLALWERGEALAARCQQWLDGARRRLDAARAEDAPGGGTSDDDTSDAPSGDAESSTTTSSDTQSRTPRSKTPQSSNPTGNDATEGAR